MFRKSLLCCLLVLGTLAWSEDPLSRFEVFGGYTYTPTNFFLFGGGESGWDAGIAANANQWIGFKGDIAQYYRSADFVRVHIKTTSFLFGPQASIPLLAAHNIRPFGQFLIGGIRDSTVNSFAWEAGGGLDFRLNRHFWLRGEGDYMHSHLRLGDDQQQPQVPRWHARVTTGLVFRF